MNIMSTSSLCPFLPPLRDLHIVELIILHPDIGLPLPDWVPPVPPILLLPWVHITLPIAHPSLCSKSLTRHVVHVHVPRTKMVAPNTAVASCRVTWYRIEQTNEAWYGKRDSRYSWDTLRVDRTVLKVKNKFSSLSQILHTYLLTPPTLPWGARWR